MKKKKTNKKVQKKEEPVQKNIQRRRRSQFRPEFKERSLKSFSTSIYTLEDVSKNLTNKNEKINGFDLVSSCSSLAHSFEMLFKSIIKRVSPYLLLAKLDIFDSKIFQIKENYFKLANNPNEKVPYCVGMVAFARALKLLKVPLSNRDLHLISEIIDKRNIFEHRDNAHIINFDTFLEDIVEGIRIYKKIYTKEFRNADLFNDTKKVTPKKGLLKIYDALDKHFSDRMKIIIELKKKKITKGITFSQCSSCLYEFLEKKSSKEKECLWCRAKEFYIKCAKEGCDNYIWSPTNENAYCKKHYLYRTSFSDILFHKIMNFEVNNKEFSDKINSIECDVQQDSSDYYLPQWLDTPSSPDDHNND